MKAYKVFLENYICEGLGTVYHATEFSQALNILKTGCIDLSPALGASIEAKLSKGKYYYLSTMRTLSSNFMKRGSDSPRKNVYFELDANSLDHNLESASVDYWGAGPTGSESEERYLSNNDRICGLDKYVKSVHVLADDDSRSRVEDPKRYFTTIMELGMYARKSKIPIYVYTDGNKYIAQRDGMTPDEYLESNGITSENKYDELYWNDIRQSQPSEKTLMDLIVNFYSGEKITSQDYKKLQDKFYWTGRANLSDFIVELKNTINSARRPGRDTNKRYIVKDLMDIIQRSKSKSIEDFIENIFVPDVKNKFGWNK